MPAIPFAGLPFDPGLVALVRRLIVAARHAPLSDALGLPQTPAKAGRLREKRVRGGPARALAISLVQRRRVSWAWRTTFATVLSSKKRSRLGLAVCNSSGKPTRL